MAKRQITVITTVFNEERSIRALLDSLAAQTALPAEIIVADAGSNDKTIERIKVWQAAHPQIGLRLLTAPGANRSAGRNLAIRAAKTDYIAVTDAGCVADRRWLAYLDHAFRSDVRVEAVAGYYRVKPESRKERAFAPYLAVMPDAFNPDTYLPSSRSLALTKKAWKRAGGYPENLDTCEDLVLAAALKKQTVMVVEPKAVVTWQLPTSFGAYYRQVSGYARGDVMAGYEPHLRRIAGVYLRYVMFGLLPPLFGLYLLAVTAKHLAQTRQAGAWLWVPVVQIVTDAGVIAGSLAGWQAKAGNQSRKATRTA